METELQDRYVVVKAQDIDKYLNDAEKAALDGILYKINTLRARDNKYPVQGVFISDSFVEYEGVKTVLLNRINIGESPPGLDIFNGWKVGDIFYQPHRGEMVVNMGVITRVRYIETDAWKSAFVDAEMVTKKGVHQVSGINIQNIHKCPISAVVELQNVGMEMVKATRGRLLARSLQPQESQEPQELQEDLT